MCILTINNLSVYYGQIQALKNINLKIDEGEIVTLLGANGAGKTTTMRCISGLIRASSGEINYLNNNIADINPSAIVSMGISQSPEGRRVFSVLSVLENLMLGGYTRPIAETKKTIDEVFAIFPRLYERKSQLAGTLSGGEQQMLAIGRALIAKPKLLLLDEPSLGLAPIIVRDIFRTLINIRKLGTTILLVEQNARMALKIADRGYVLETGKIVIEGKSLDLINSDEIQTSYLGGKK